jgi:hypothetical protein
MADELNKPSKGTGDWNIPLNQNFDTLEAAARAFLPRGTTVTLNVSDINADRVGFGQASSEGTTQQIISTELNTEDNYTKSSQFTDNVSTTVKEIYKMQNSGLAGQIYVHGEDRNNKNSLFSDILNVTAFDVVQVVDSLDRNAPASRSYSMNNANVDLSMGSSSYDVVAVGTTARRRGNI